MFLAGEDYEVAAVNGAVEHECLVVFVHETDADQVRRVMGRVMRIAPVDHVCADCPVHRLLVSLNQSRQGAGAGELADPAFDAVNDGRAAHLDEYPWPLLTVVLLEAERALECRVVTLRSALDDGEVERTVAPILGGGGPSPVRSDGENMASSRKGGKAKNRKETKFFEHVEPSCHFDAKERFGVQPNAEESRKGNEAYKLVRICSVARRGPRWLLKPGQ